MGVLGAGNGGKPGEDTEYAELANQKVCDDLAGIVCSCGKGLMLFACMMSVIL